MRPNFLTCPVNVRTVSIYTAAVMIFLVTLDLLATRQILYFDNSSEIILFTLTVVIGYGIGSWILLEYTRQITANLRSKSLLVNTMHWTVTIIQFSLLGILFFVLAAATSAIAITEDAYTKLMFVSVVEEISPLGAIPQASFIYLNSEKYHGEIQYKVVNPDTTTLWILPSSLVLLKNSLDYLATLPYIFTWMAVAALLRKYHRSLGLEKFSFKFWII